MTTFFDLPILPDQFGVVLSSPTLRKIDFSGLDYSTARRAIIEYIMTYHPDNFNDFVAANGIMMLTEIVASVVAKLSLRQDMLAMESTLPTCKTETAGINHLALINQRIRRQLPATTDIELSVDQPTFTNVEIPPGMVFTVPGADTKPIYYEIYKAPGDWDSNIVIPAGKRGVIAYGLEGRFSNTVNASSTGAPDQIFTIQDAGILEYPLLVDVSLGSDTTRWLITTEPLEKHAPNDKVVEVTFLGDQIKFRFGNNVTGKIPSVGSQIKFKYRVGGGVRGRIGVGQISTSLQITPAPPANSPLAVNVRNITPATGGADKESLEQAKQRAPRDFAMQRSIVSAGDYAQAAKSYSHPVFGSIAKTLATIRTSKNANLVEVYTLAVGSDNLPTAPNLGLKQGLATYFSQLNVFTDQVSILDGVIKPVDVELVIVVNKNSDTSIVKGRVEAAITEYFNIANWEMGQSFYTSNFIQSIEAVDGISYINLISPVNNIIPTDRLAGEADGVGFNEMITEGSRKTTYYYEKSSAR